MPVPAGGRVDPAAAGPRRDGGRVRLIGAAPGFGGIDLAFFLGYMVIVLAIGFLSARREKATVGD